MSLRNIGNSVVEWNSFKDEGNRFNTGGLRMCKMDRNKIHCIDSPAIIYIKYCKCCQDNEMIIKKWYYNNQLHRNDGPAIEDSHGCKMWFFNGKLHRINGPAIIYPNGINEYWKYGRKI